jgi:SpoVK/Ycf46/Vps4 family AAA+-type ATPase
MKRKSSFSSNTDEYFKIEEHSITDLKSLINLTYDLINKPKPPKKILKTLPNKLFKLIDIIEPLEQLNNLIGLTNLKQQLLDQLLFFISNLDNDTIMLHTVIEGPPGTGKTTIANLMSEIYAGIGILKKNKFRVVKREDLIGQYLGETTIKTMECLDSCKNGVMLIDEAYSLGSGESGNADSFSKECIDALNQYLTENVDKFICIIAGYKNELNKCFFSLNPGLKRRFPWTFTIGVFNENELSQIFIKMINDTELWELEESINISYLENLFNKDYFDGNGGDIQNLFSKAKIIYARVTFCKENNYILTKKIIEEAYDLFIKNKKTNLLTKPPFGMYN